ncbi:DinB family protein [Shivajiella indica]|uniref:DinB family protein n=1 Tax=Shivajiella indica TaxID=872115 RepID=A0ABW5BAL4_9BACT
MEKTKKIFMLGLGLIAFLCVQTMSSAQTTMEEFLTKWEAGKQFSLEVVDKMPDQFYDYRPEASGMSFREQVTHLSSAIVGISQRFLKGQEPGFDFNAKPATKAELKAFVEACYDYGTKTFKNLGMADLDEKVEIFGTAASRREVIALIDDHCTHHRGAAVSYIRAQGIEPPRYRGMGM